jgi:ABC-type amino acid transport substrate-binding protein
MTTLPLAPSSQTLKVTGVFANEPRHLRAILVALALSLAWISLADAQELRGTLKKIRESETITLGFRESARPFAFAGPGGQPSGYSVDLCLRVTEAIREQLGLAAIKTPWVPVTADTRIPLVVGGAIDLECGSTTHTLGRQALVDFSLLTFDDGGSLLTRVGANVSAVDDLANKRVAVIPGTTTEKALASALQKSWVSTARIVPVRDHAEGLAAVEGGRAEAFASDRTVLVGLLEQAKDQRQLRVSNRYFSYEPYALMLRRDDPDFRLAVDRALARLYQSALLPQIYEKWFGRFSQASSLLQAMYTLGSLPD